jgi:hypothetical protein
MVRQVSKHIKRHATVTTALSPHLRDVRRVGHNRGATDDRGDPTGGDPQGASFARPCHVRTDPPELPRHTEPQSTTASHCDRLQVPHHTIHDTQNHDTQNHDTQNHNSLRRWSQDTAHGTTAPMAPDTPRHPTRLFLGAARSHQCPLHQPGPLHAGQVTTAPHTHASADGAPHPFSCHAAPMQQPAHKATTQHRPAAPTPGLGNRNTGHGRTPTLIPPTTRAAHTPPAICWRCWRAGRTREFGSKATFTRAAALRPPPPRGAGLFTLLISI